MKQKIYTVFLAFLLIFITLSMIIFPEESFHASLRGLDMWWKIVFPSLLPFFIAAELLIRFGVVKFIGVLFEPIMRPLFNVPGIGSFAWLVGMASGYPSGAKITATLRERKQITQIEAERLVSFTNAASPLFIFGAIAVGLFHRPDIGIIIALCHYAGNVLVGICMRFYQHERKQRKNSHPTEFMIKRAFKSMHRTRVKDKQPLGEIVGESVNTSVQTLLMIGGFIILFSVLTSLLELANITYVIELILSPIFLLFHIPAAIVPGVFSGFFEITLGADIISEIKSIPLSAKLVCVSFILGFNGFSIHAQVASILARTDIRFKAYFYGRLLHALFSSTLCFLVVPLILKENNAAGFPVFSNAAHSQWEWLQTIHTIGPIITILSILLSCIFLLRPAADSR